MRGFDLSPPHAGATAGVLSRILEGLRHPSLPRLFRQRVIKGGEDECWPWDGMVKESGHGRFQLRTRVCDNPGCVNPKHLWLGTAQENTADMVEKGRAFRPIGEMAPRSKLTAAQVTDMRARYRPGRKGGCNTAAAEFGISTASASAILLRKTWKHLP